MISANYSGGLVQTTPVKITTTSTTDIYADGTKEEVCVSFCIVNEHSSALAVSVYVNDGTSDVLYWEKSVPANDTLIETDAPMKLRDGYKITAQVGTINVITITPTILRQS